MDNLFLEFPYNRYLMATNRCEPVQEIQDNFPSPLETVTAAFQPS
ncbi:MAG: hypothetical protein V7L29_19560 [Nostoc sp.]